MHLSDYIADLRDVSSYSKIEHTVLVKNFTSEMLGIFSPLFSQKMLNILFQYRFTRILIGSVINFSVISKMSCGRVALKRTT